MGIGFYQAGMTACSSERGRIMAVDAPPALGELLLTAIEEVTDEPVTQFIYSHWDAIMPRQQCPNLPTAPLVP